jgi:type IV pilus assembly protein PilW
MNRTNTRPRPFSRQRGYSIIELAIAILIAVFLLGGLFSILQSTRDTSTNQNLLAQLQDNERIAMTILQETVQTAGYYPAPITTNAVSAFPAAGTFTQAGQSIVGGANGTAALGDTITVRYQSDGTTAVIGCLGTSDTTAGVSHTYQFFVQADPGGKTWSLYCVQDGGTAMALVPNVSSMTVKYGVDTTGTGTGVNAYLTATAMNSTPTDWLNVYSVQLTLNFTNPLFGQSGQTATTAATLPFTRVVNLMSRTGGNVSVFN